MSASFCVRVHYFTRGGLLPNSVFLFSHVYVCMYAYIYIYIQIVEIPNACCSY